MDVEIDIETSVLGFDPIPPKRKLLDLVPNFIVDRLRRWFGFPMPTPREHWHLCLFFVRTTLTTMMELEAGRVVAERPQHDIKPEDLN
jgi:hypothetical protein